MLSLETAPVSWTPSVQGFVQGQDYAGVLFPCSPFSVDCMTSGDSFSLLGLGPLHLQGEMGFQACLAPQSPQRHLLFVTPSLRSLYKQGLAWLETECQGFSRGYVLLPGTLFGLGFNL